MQLDSEFNYRGAPPSEANGCYVEFFEYAEHLPAKSELEGRPIYQTVPYIRIHIPGGKSIIERAVTEEDRYEHPRQWARFEAKKEQIGDGTPLSAWPAMDVAHVAELNAQKIFTVEQLAGLNDSQVLGLGLGATELRKKAQAYLDVAGGNVGAIEALSGENARLKEEMDALRAQFAELKAAAESQVEARSKRGEK